jgi:hypothetical protein
MNLAVMYVALSVELFRMFKLFTAQLTGRDTSNRVRCSKLAARGGSERETGRGPEAVVGHQARLTVWSILSPRPHHGVGRIDPE